MAAVSRSPNPGRDFNVFWAGQTLSVLGDAFAVVALPLLVLQATGSLARMGLVTALFGVGSLLAGLVAGPLADRVDRRRLMIGCDLGRALVYALIPLAWWLAGPQPWLLYAVTLAGAALGMTFGVAYVAALPNLVDRDRLTEANGRLEATFAVAFVLGPMLAGLVSARFGPTAAIGIDALTFLASALSLAVVRLRPVPAGRPEDPHAAGDRLGELLAGVRFLRGEPLFRWLVLLVGGVTFAAFGVTDLYIYFLRVDLGQGDRAVGVVYGLASLGAIAGGLLAPRLRRRWGFGACFAGGVALQAAAALAAGVAPSLAAVAVVATLFTFGETTHRIATVSLRQELVPDHLLGRVSAAFRTFFLVPGPLGAAALTAFGERAGARPAFLLMGGLLLLLTLAVLASPARARHPTLSGRGPTGHGSSPQPTAPLGSLPVDDAPSDGHRAG